MDFLVPLSGSTNMNIASLVFKSQPTAVKRVKVFQKTILLCSWVFCFCLFSQLMEQKVQNLQKWMQHLLNGFTAIVAREDISAPKLVGVVWITKSPQQNLFFRGLVLGTETRIWCWCWITKTSATVSFLLMGGVSHDETLQWPSCFELLVDSSRNWWLDSCMIHQRSQKVVRGDDAEDHQHLCNHIQQYDHQHDHQHDDKKTETAGASWLNAA